MYKRQIIVCKPQLVPDQYVEFKQLHIPLMQFRLDAVEHW